MDPLAITAYSFQNPKQDVPAPQAELDSWRRKADHARLLDALYGCDPKAAARLAQALALMPAVGADFYGFRLLAELGRGGFARVYLAEQSELAGRHVVVKVEPDLWGEACTLAQMQHPNIVPVYSAHGCGPFQVVCMPYLGWTTFQDLLNDVQKQATPPTLGTALLKAIKLPPAEATRTDGGVAEPVRAALVEQWTRSSFVEVIVGLFTQLANGLAHAHEHGIVHHDLKPANLLLTDDGLPMLLDFNAAQDTKLSSEAMVALVVGTLPYLAPERLAAMQGSQSTADARSDLYAFGVIMFEMLTGRYPFKCRQPELATIFDKAMDDRRTPPRLREFNPAISPALEAIVRRCLEPDAERRYQTARQLHEDLFRQHSHLPLLHTPEPSRRERLQKWTHRHPRLMTAALVTGFAAVLLASVGGLAMVRGQQIGQWEIHHRQRVALQKDRAAADAQWRNFQDDWKTVQFLLYTRANEPEQLQRGIAVGMRQLERYDVVGNPAWRDAKLVTALANNDREHLLENMGEMLLLVVRAILLRDAQADGRGPSVAAATLLTMNQRAEACSPTLVLSPALWRQRGALHGRLGQENDARACRARADDLPLRTAADHYWMAGDHISGGRLREALPLLQTAVRMEPQNFWAWFVLAHAWNRLGVDVEAKAGYSVCVALQPSFAWAYFNRGLTLLRLQDFRSANADFDAFIAMRPDLAEGFWNRALARQGLGQHEDAEQDFTMALDRGGASWLHFLRARVREKRGDKVGARRDFDDAMRRPPADEKGWLARGFYQLGRDPKAALGDFEQALQLNPRSADGLQNKAHVLAEKLGRPKDALAALDTLVELYPDSVKARSGRGVIHARLGDRELALRDIEETLQRDASPPRLYQVACIYALNSQQHPEDRVQAFQYLSSALRRGYGFNLLETDPDLNPIRALPEFRRLVDAARMLRPAPAKKKG